MLSLIAAGCQAPDAGPTATSTPPRASATLAATAIHTLTPMPTQAGAATATRTPKPSATLITRACEDPYLVAAPGVAWTYSVSGSPAGDFDFTQRVSAVRSDSFTLSSRIGDERYLHTWTCAEEGIVAQQFDGVAATGIALAAGQITLDTDAVSGITLPTELAAGDRWQQVYTVSGTQSLEGLPDAAVSGTVTMNYEVIGTESISVPYGSFEALHIRIYSVYDVRVGNPPFSFRPEINGTAEAYYVESIGLVKVDTDLSFIGDQRHVEVELIDYAFPD